MSQINIVGNTAGAANIGNVNHHAAHQVEQLQQALVSEEQVEAMKQFSPAIAKFVETASKMNEFLAKSGRKDSEEMKRLTRNQKSDGEAVQEMLKTVAPDLSQHVEDLSRELTVAKTPAEINNVATKALTNIRQSVTYQNYQNTLGQNDYMDDSANNSANTFGDSLTQLLQQLGDNGGTGSKTNTLVLAIAVCLALALIGANIVDSYTNMIAENGTQVKLLNNTLNAFVSLQKKLPYSVTFPGQSSPTKITSVRQLFEAAYGGGVYATTATPAGPGPDTSLQQALSPLMQVLSPYTYNGSNPTFSSGTTNLPATGESLMAYLKANLFSNAATNGTNNGKPKGDNVTIVINYLMNQMFTQVNNALTHMGADNITPDISTNTSPSAGQAMIGNYQFQSGDISSINSLLQSGIATGGNTSQSLGVELETQQTNYTKCVGLAKSIEGMFAGLTNTIASIN